MINVYDHFTDKFQIFFTMCFNIENTELNVLIRYIIYRQYYLIYSYRNATHFVKFVYFVQYDIFTFYTFIFRMLFHLWYKRLSISLEKLYFWPCQQKKKNNKNKLCYRIKWYCFLQIWDQKQQWLQRISALFYNISTEVSIFLSIFIRWTCITQRNTLLYIL